MRQYPLTESELVVIGNAGAASAFCVSIGGGLIGFSINLYKDMKVGQVTLAKDQIAAANAINSATLVFGLCFIIVGIVLYLYGRRTLDKIKASTTFDDGLPAFVIPIWHKVLFYAVLWTIPLVGGVAIGMFYK
jgi:nitrate reductase gamma subunit